MKYRYAASQKHYQRMSTAELRDHFLVENLFIPGVVELLYWETDRTVLGGVVPGERPLRLENDPALAAQSFCERRELGVYNLGGPGEVMVDEQHFPLACHDAVYIGRGSREITFLSSENGNPARFFLVSYPAHTAYPNCLISYGSANRVDLGAAATANQRSIFQYIHEGGARSCQLVTGLTQLQPGNLWNTMPPHTHARRSEVYLYFDLPEDGAVFHLMGPPDETRHLVVRSGQAVLSPIWSIHAGCGSQAYSFIWAMGGENQRFTDMDAFGIGALK